MGVNVVDRNAMVEQLAVVEQDSDACLADLQIADVPIAGVGQRDADVVAGLVAKNPGAGSGAIRTQGNRFSRCASAGERHFLIPGASTREEYLIAGGEPSDFVDWRKGTPWLIDGVSAAIAAV